MNYRANNHPHISLHTPLQEYLDYTKNPCSVCEVDYSSLDSEARDYLVSVGACFGRPIDRLKHMNMPAYDLYLSKGVDLEKEMLEIALCAQHNNGGIAVDMWWQTAVKGLFCAGECAGTHGITRPGGSALNAGQVGSLRAAQYISQNGNKLIEDSVFESVKQKLSEFGGEIPVIIYCTDNNKKLEAPKKLWVNGENGLILSNILSNFSSTIFFSCISLS